MLGAAKVMCFLWFSFQRSSWCGLTAEVEVQQPLEEEGAQRNKGLSVTVVGSRERVNGPQSTAHWLVLVERK